MFESAVLVEVMIGRLRCFLGRQVSAFGERLADAWREVFQDHFFNEVVQFDVFDGVLYFCKMLRGT